eukprot:1151364-Pelagomonas_calceolata.AAC.7
MTYARLYPVLAYYLCSLMRAYLGRGPGKIQGHELLAAQPPQRLHHTRQVRPAAHPVHKNKAARLHHPSNPEQQRECERAVEGS